MVALVAKFGVYESGHIDRPITELSRILETAGVTISDVLYRNCTVIISNGRIPTLLVRRGSIAQAESIDVGYFGPVVLFFDRCVWYSLNQLLRSATASAKL